MTDLTHQRSALAVVVGDESHRARLEAEARARTFNELYAGEYLARLRRGETGAASAYLGALRRNSGADPWALLEVVAARALAAHPETFVPPAAADGKDVEHDAAQ